MKRTGPLGGWRGQGDERGVEAFEVEVMVAGIAADDPELLGGRSGGPAGVAENRPAIPGSGSIGIWFLDVALGSIGSFLHLWARAGVGGWSGRGRWRRAVGGERAAAAGSWEVSEKGVQSRSEGRRGME